MDLFSLFIGVVFGVVLGGLMTWFAATTQAQAKTKRIEQTESELKELFSQQASQHLAATKDAVASIQTQLETITSQISHYEANLQKTPQENTNEAFFGEHASVFLRNTQQQRIQKSSDNTEAQPKDFSNQSTGLFAGTADEASSALPKESN